MRPDLRAGFAGALATNIAHELVRRMVPEAPRVDLLGMQALSLIYRRAGVRGPTGRTLYLQTLAGDLVTNSVYFAAAGLGATCAFPLGAALGLVAGVGAIAVPAATALDASTTSRTPRTGALVVGLYGLGGVVADLVARRA